MNKLCQVLLCGLLSVVTHSAMAQFQGAVYAPFQDAAVKQYGNDIRSPWCGGINSVQVNHADINNDGKQDVVLYDFNHAVIKTFINTGNAGEIKYTYDPKYEANFPNISYYLLLVDYNCDNIPDLFEKGLFGVAVHTGYYQNNELKFVFYKDLFFPGFNGPVNVYVQPSDIPSIVDIDKDGDLDILSFDVLGTQLAYYKNLRVEDGLPCDSLRMILADNCWGKFYQSLDRKVNMNIACKGVEAQYKKTRHTGNCIVHFDADGDSDLDLLGGNISFSDIQMLYNNGSDVINGEDTTYDKNAHILQMPSWPAPAYEDIDNDGDKDIVISCHNDNLSTANYNAIAFYKNTGTNATPHFVFQHDTLLTPDMIDVGSYSYPVFYDYNKDGKQDLFVGTEGYLDNNTVQLHSKLAYYKNTSVGSNISFELVTKDFLNLSAKNYHGIFPSFGDLTGDGVDDLVLGSAEGTIAVYKNFSANNSLTPNLLYFTDSVNNVFVTNYSMPVVYDFNQDGKTDLLIGNQAGQLAYYEDSSTAVNLKKLYLKKANLGNFTAGSPNNFYGYCAPFIGKIDNSLKTYLLIGNIDGNIERYDENFINNLGNFNRIDSNYSLIKTAPRAVPAVADLDGDGDFEMVVGNKYGGLHYYKQVLTVSHLNDYIQQSSIEIYPNPAQNNIALLYKTPIGNITAHLLISDVMGRAVQSEFFETEKKSVFDISGLPSGIYHLTLTLGNQTLTKRLLKY